MTFPLSFVVPEKNFESKPFNGDQQPFLINTVKKMVG